MGSRRVRNSGASVNGKLRTLGSTDESTLFDPRFLDDGY